MKMLDTYQSQTKYCWLNIVLNIRIVIVIQLYKRCDVAVTR